MLPDSVVNRDDKMGFPIPLAAWLKGPCNDWVHDVFSTGTTIGRDYVDAAAIPPLLDAESTFGRTMWGYLSLELWHQQFVDRASRFQSLNPDNAPKVAIKSHA